MLETLPTSCVCACASCNLPLPPTLRKYRHDDLPAGHELPEGEIHWTTKSTLLYPLICTTAGLMAGLFGIGGGGSMLCALR
jgi:uncharacterized membrane protein YfcA